MPIICLLWTIVSSCAHKMETSVGRSSRAPYQRNYCWKKCAGPRNSQVSWQKHSFIVLTSQRTVAVTLSQFIVQKIYLKNGQYQSKWIVFHQMMACINPAQQYQWKISDLFDSFLNSMKDSRARVEVDSQRHEGLCIVKITLWKCRSCPKHLYLFRTLF